MKKIYTFLFLLLGAGFLHAQNAVLRYEFINSLNEKNGAGPALTVLGDQGSFGLDTLNEINGNTKTVYRFAKNSGLQFNNAAAGNFVGTNYSIEIYFVFDELSSWKRVIDWKNRKSDNGAYVYNGKLNFYNYVTSEDAPVIAGEYTYYVVTRNASTKQTIIYTDADQEVDFTDINNEAVVDADNVLNFFQDDLIVGNEASTGAVALINIYNYILDPATIASNFENLGGQVFSVNEIRKSEGPVEVYPNPATDYLSINLKEFPGSSVEISIYNAAGARVYNHQTAGSGNNEVTVSTQTWPEGIYFVRATSEESTATRKLVIRH